MAIPTSFRNGVEVANATAAGDDAFFVGDRDTDGSWKIYSSSGVYTVARRESSVWVDKLTLSSASVATFSAVVAEGYTATDDGIVFGDETAAGAFRLIISGSDLSIETTVGPAPVSWAPLVMVKDTGTIDLTEIAAYYATFTNQSVTPSDPASGKSVMWVDFTSGDLKIKINVGGTVKTATIVDYSAV